MNKNILIIEDDLEIQELLSEFLINEGYNVDTTDNGVDGIQKFKNNKYDLILLDIMMPNLDGYSVCKIIRLRSNIPIIFISALTEEYEQLKGFDLDCDDYITKPFSFNLLVKKVNALLKRSSINHSNEILTFDRLKLNLNTYTVHVDNTASSLTLTEFNILKCIMENYPKITTREALLDTVWGYDYYGDSRNVDAHIKNIRKKIKTQYIKTVKGIGYTLEKN